MIIIFTVVLLAAAGVWIYILRTKNPQLPTKTLTIRDISFMVEIADTELTRMRGLSGRESLGEREGMLFIFPSPAKYSFWMKGMKFPLDFVWIRDGVVADITANVDSATSSILASFAPKEPVNWVLEVPAVTVENNHLQIGDQVILGE